MVPRTRQRTFGADVVRVTALGGLEEVGKNMMVFEYRNDIIIIDMGFQFPTEEMPGIDFVIPDVSYLEDKKDRIRGVIFTHGHYDHVMAAPFLLPKTGYPRMYATALTKGMLEKILSEHALGQSPVINVINPEKDVLRLGSFQVEFFRVNHNIPDSIGVILTTPVGTFVHTGDFKFDMTPVNEPVTDFAKIAAVGQRGVLALFSDSTNAEQAGYAVSEREIKKMMEQIFNEAEGRIIVASFSSLLARIQQVFDATAKYGRKVGVFGRSMANNIEIGLKLGYLKASPQLFLKPNELNRQPDEKVVILSTGSQGEDNAGLARMSRGEHKQVKIKKGDTVILSSSVIPGNERSVVTLYDGLLAQGANVFYQKIMDVHTGGHAKQEELKMMIALTKPKYLIPIHGERHMRVAHQKIGFVMGLTEDKVLLPDNSQVMEFGAFGGRVTDKRVPSSFVMVDGLGVGDVGQVVLRDRQLMSKDGIFVIIVTVDHRSGSLVSSPDIISRGFVYLRESEKLLADTRSMIKKIMAKGVHEGIPADWSHIKMRVREEIGQFLYDETRRRPMIIPVVIEV